MANFSLLRREGSSFPNKGIHQGSLTDGIDFVHEDDARLMVPGVVEHLPDQPGAFADILVHDRTGHHLQEAIGSCGRQPIAFQLHFAEKNPVW